jgi:hypothetical protein
MQISPIKSTLKPPRIEPNKIGLRASSSSKVSGNSIQLIGTTPGTLPVMEIWGETVGKKAVFGTATVTVTGVASLPFTGGASLTFSGFATTANNKTVTLTSISGLVMTFPAGSFTAATELQGTISDGTNTVNIAVSPTGPQVLTSITNFDYYVSGKNAFNTTWEVGAILDATGQNSAGTNNARTAGYIPVKPNGQYVISMTLATAIPELKIYYYDKNKNFIGLESAGNVLTRTYTINPLARFVRFRTYRSGGTDIIPTKTQLETGTVATTYEAYQGVTASVPLKDTSNNQLILAGRALTYNANGTPATWYGRDQVIKKTDGKWYHRKNGAFEANATERADFWNLITPVDTELSAADQTALNSIAKTFAGTTNIMLSTDIGQVYVELSQWSDSAKR